MVHIILTHNKMIILDNDKIYNLDLRIKGEKGELTLEDLRTELYLLYPYIDEMLVDSISLTQDLQRRLRGQDLFIFIPPGYPLNFFKILRNKLKEFHTGSIKFIDFDIASLKVMIERNRGRIIRNGDFRLIRRIAGEKHVVEGRIRTEKGVLSAEITRSGYEERIKDNKWSFEFQYNDIKDSIDFGEFRENIRTSGLYINIIKRIKVGIWRKGYSFFPIVQYPQKKKGAKIIELKKSNEEIPFYNIVLMAGFEKDSPDSVAIKNIQLYKNEVKRKNRIKVKLELINPFKGIVELSGEKDDFPFYREEFSTGLF